MGLRDPSRQREPEARPAGARGHERFEESVRDLRWNTGAVVGHDDLDMILATFDASDDVNLPRRGRANGVLVERMEKPSGEPDVRPDEQPVRDDVFEVRSR